MNCEQAEQRMVDYLYGELSPEDRQAFERHLQSCPEHARELEKLAEVLNLLRGQEPQAVPERLSERILHLAKAACDQKARAPARPWARLLANPVAAAAVLAGVILTVGLAVTKLSERERKDQSIAAPATAPIAAPAEEADEGATARPAGPARQKQEVTLAMKTADEKKPEREKNQAGSGTVDLLRADKESKAPNKIRSTARPKKSRRHANKRRVPRETKAKGVARGSGWNAPVRKAEKKRDASSRAMDFDDLGIGTGGKAGGAGPQQKPPRFAAPPPPTVLAPAAGVKRTRRPQAKAAPEPEAPAMAAGESASLEESESAPAAERTVPEPSRRAKAKPSEESRNEKDTQIDLYRQAETRLAAKDYPAALSAFRRFLTLHPGDRRAATCRFRIAKTLFLMGRCPEAVRATGQALQASPAHAMAPSALLDQASCHVRLGQFEKARSVYRRIERDFPGHADQARRGMKRIEGNN